MLSTVNVRLPERTLQRAQVRRPEEDSLSGEDTEVLTRLTDFWRKLSI